MNPQANRTIIATNTVIWLENRNKRKYTHYLITPEGLGYYVLNGILIPAEEFENLYPVELEND